MVVLKFPVGLHSMKFVASNIAGILAVPSNFTAQIVFGVVAVVLNICHVFAVAHKDELAVFPNVRVDIAVLVMAVDKRTNSPPFIPLPGEKQIFVV